MNIAGLHTHQESNRSKIEFYEHVLDVWPGLMLSWHQLKFAFQLFSTSTQAMVEMLQNKTLKCLTEIGNEWYLTGAGVCVVAGVIANIPLHDRQLLKVLNRLQMQRSDCLQLQRLYPTVILASCCYHELFPQYTRVIVEDTIVEPSRAARVVNKLPERSWEWETRLFDSHRITIKQPPEKARTPGIWVLFRDVQTVLSMRGVSMEPFKTLITEADVEPSKYIDILAKSMSPLGVLLFTITFGRQQIIENLLWHLLIFLNADSGDIFRTLNLFAPNNLRVWNLAVRHFRLHVSISTPLIKCNSEVSYGTQSDGDKFLIYKEKRYTTIPNEYPERKNRALRRRAKLSPSIRVRIESIASLTGPQKKNIHTFFGSNGSSVYYQCQAFR
jgi:hypothetical protein